jgi:hypothetical protein
MLLFLILSPVPFSSKKKMPRTAGSLPSQGWVTSLVGDRSLRRSPSGVRGADLNVREYEMSFTIWQDWWVSSLTDGYYSGTVPRAVVVYCTAPTENDEDQ